MDEVRFRGAIKAGAIGGAVVIFVGVVGMLTNFDGLSLVGDELNLGLVLLLAPALVAAVVASRPRIVAGELRSPTTLQAFVAGGESGAIAGAAVAVVAGLVEILGIERVRPVFVNVTDELLEIVLFGQAWALGSLILIALLALTGGVAAVGSTMPARIRRPLVVAIAAVLTMALLHRIVPTILLELDLDPTWLYSRVTLGLTWFGAIVVFVVAAATSIVWSERRRFARARGPSTGVPDTRKLTKTLWLLAIFVVLLALPQLVGSVISEVLGAAAIFVLLGLGLNIVVGYAGLLDLGYVAFFAVGAYFTALLTGADIIAVLGTAEPAFSLNLSFYAAIPIVVLIAAFVGLLIGAPVLRLRGDYLAIVTLGFGEIARVLVTSEWLKPAVGGAQGLRDITSAPLLGFTFRRPQNFYYLVLAFCLLAVYVSSRLANSRVGRAWNAMREDEQVADAMGISTVRYKLLAFAIGGAVGSLGGALFVVRLGVAQPGSFEILVSITVLAAIILGGIGSVPGVVVGALVLVGLPGLLSQFEEFRLLIYGAVLVAIMILRPQGIVPNVRRSRELKEEELAQDEWARERLGVEPQAAAVAVAGGKLGAEEGKEG
jgi:branched-chain amino acid transport system permease protein